MKQNFKKAAMAGALVGCLAIGGLGTVAMANGNAYQSYKNAALQTVSESNMTINSKVTIKKDGKAVMSGDMLNQIDGNKSYSSCQMDANGQAIDVEESYDGNQMVIRNGDKYTSTTSRDHGEESEQISGSSNSKKLAEMVADLLVGDVKNNFTANGDTISVNLEGPQIPELLNVATAAMMEQTDSHKNNTKDQELALIDNLSITKDAKLKGIHMDATVKDGTLGSNNIVVTLSGSDNAGVNHVIEITFDATITNIGSTTVTTIDTTGKTVTEAKGDYRD